MTIKWNYRVFLEDNGDYIIREVFYPTFRRYLDKFNSFKLGGIKPWNQYIATVSSIAKSI